MALELPKSFMYEATDIPAGVKASEYHSVERKAAYMKHHPTKRIAQAIRRSTHKGIAKK